VPTMVPGGRAYPIMSKISSVTPLFKVEEGTTRSRRLGAAEYNRRPVQIAVSVEDAARNQWCVPSFKKALKYGNSPRTAMSGNTLGSGIASSSSARSFVTISGRRVSSQRKKVVEMDAVSVPAMLLLNVSLH